MDALSRPGFRAVVPRTPSLPAAVAGVASVVAGLGVGHLVAAVMAPVSSPVVAVANRVVDLSPEVVKAWAIALFGAADKAVLLVGVIVVTLALGAMLGLLARRSLRLGVLGGAALIVLALVAAGLEPARPFWWPVPSLVALGTGAWALSFLVGRVPAPPPDPVSTRAAADAGASRRKFLWLGASVGGAGLLAGFLGDRIVAWGGGGGTAPGPFVPVELPSRSMSAFPAGLEGQVPGLSAFVTPASEFYRVDTALVVPRVDAASWRLSIDGMVDHPFSLGWDELLAMEPVEKAVTLACVSNDVGGPYIGSARWLGARTSELLARAGVQAGADQVLSTSQDGFTVSTPLAALTDGREALVAYGMNGAALPLEHGYPVRLLTPGLYGFVGATKWLVRMTLTTYSTAPAYWTVRGWSTVGNIKPSSRIEVPRDRASVRAGVVRVGGTAWAHGVGVGRVQVRVDRGPWQDATLGPDAGIEYWRQWVFDWNAMAGEHELQVRVVDAAGTPQDEAIVPPFPSGSSGLHTVTVVVA